MRRYIFWRVTATVLMSLFILVGTTMGGVFGGIILGYYTKSFAWGMCVGLLIAILLGLVGICQQVADCRRNIERRKEWDS